MQHAAPSLGDAASSTSLPKSPIVADRIDSSRAAGGHAGADHGRALFRRYAAGWSPAVLALIVIELLAIPVTDNPATVVLLVALTAASGAAMMFAGYTLSRERPGRWPLVAIAVVDVVAIVVAVLSATGNDTTIVMPFLGGLLLVALYDGRALKLGLTVQWAVGTAGAAIAYAGRMSGIRDADPLPVSIAVSAVTMFVGYCLLWWVRRRLTAAISGARTAEADARRHAEALELLLASSPVPTLGFDLRGRVVSWNPAAERVLGWSAEDLGGTVADILAPEASEDAPSTLVARVLGGEVVDGVRASWRHRDGKPVTIGLHAALLSDPEGAPSGVVLQAVDETEREALRARVDEMQRLEAVGRLAGGVAHDFNNVLTAVSGYAQLLQGSMDEDDPRMEDARQIELAAARGSGLVRQLLTFSRRQVVRPVVLEPNALVEGLRPMLGRLIGTQVRIHVELDPDIAPVCVDPGQFEQVVVNLAVNARDAMPDGGDLTIRTAGTMDAAGCPVVRLSVTDTGIGMDGATQKHAFEPFFTTKGPGRGTGLGLATVYGIVSTHGGSISLLSAPGRGTTFHVDLPPAVEAIHEGQAPVAPRPERRPRGSGTVLVVDDEETVRRFAARALASVGYRVLEAADLWGALSSASAEDGPIDLVLSDVIMPDCRGPELVRRLTRLRPEARVLYMSGFHGDGPAGVLDDLHAPLLVKPFTVAELAQAAGEVLAEPQPVG